MSNFVGVHSFVKAKSNYIVCRYQVMTTCNKEIHQPTWRCLPWECPSPKGQWAWPPTCRTVVSPCWRGIQGSSRRGRPSPPVHKRQSGKHSRWSQISACSNVWLLGCQRHVAWGWTCLPDLALQYQWDDASGWNFWPKNIGKNFGLLKEATAKISHHFSWQITWLPASIE